MPEIRRLDAHAAVAPQLLPTDLAAVKLAGFTTIVNNRPDGEEAGQPDDAAMRAAAEAAGLAYHAIPIAGGMSRADLDATAAAFAAGPTLAYCRSGTRSCHLWALARAAAGDHPDTLLAKAAGAGYDLTPLRPALVALARERG